MHWRWASMLGHLTCLFPVTSNTFCSHNWHHSTSKCIFLPEPPDYSRAGLISKSSSFAGLKGNLVI